MYLRAALAAVLLLFVTHPVRAGCWRQRPVLRIDRLDSSSPPVIRIYLTRLDHDGRVERHGRSPKYRLVVNGLPQKAPTKVESFVERREPIALAFVIQSAPSMRPVFQDARAEMVETVRGLSARSVVAVAAYPEVAGRPNNLASLSQAVRELENIGIREDAQEMELRAAITQLKDAVGASIEALSATRLPTRKIIVVSAVRPAASPDTVQGVQPAAALDPEAFADLGRRAQERGIAIHSIGVLLQPKDEHLRTLCALSSKGGGTFRAGSSVAELRRAFADLRGELRHQMVLSYTLPELFNGKINDFQVELGAYDLASNIVSAELLKWKRPESSSSLLGSPWFILLLVVLLLALTGVGVVVWRKRSRRERELLPTTQTTAGVEDRKELKVSEDTDDGEDEDEEEKEGWKAEHAPRPGPAQVGPSDVATTGDATDAGPSAPGVMTRIFMGEQSPSPVPSSPPPGPVAPPARPLPSAGGLGKPKPSAGPRRHPSPAILPAAPKPALPSPGVLPLPDPDEFIRAMRQSEGQEADAPPAPATPPSSPPILATRPAGSGALAREAAAEPLAAELVAWVAPLDGPLQTLVLREGFTVSSAPPADHVVAAGPGSPRRGVFRLQQGTWTVSLDGASPSALVDNQRFAVGATEFVFKTAQPVKTRGDSDAWLEVIDGVDNGRQIPLREDRPCSIGRDPSCTVVVRGEGVGPRHLQARLNDGCCELDDLGCEAGMRFAGNPVGHVALRPGQEVAVGSIRLVFRRSGWSGR